MNEAPFLRILRSALLLSMTSSGVVAACGGAVETVGGDGTSSGSPGPTAPATSVPLPPTTEEVPPSPPPPKKDSGVLDASKDASKDAVADAGCGQIVQQDVCTATVYDPCELPPDGGGWNQQECATYCPGGDGGPSPAFGCNVSKDQTGTTVLQCYYCIIGRRPEGLVPSASADGDALGAFFANASHLEAASVDAFERLARDLEEHDAPADLRARARRSGKDEIRHARTTARLATMFGARPGGWSARPSIEPRRRRTLEEIAIENATEGCIRETFGALVGMFQAERAEDATIRGAMKTIARDESRHAALAWSILGWTLEKLDGDGRARLDEAMNAALARLARDVVVEPPAPLRTRAGLPSAREAAVLVAAFRQAMPSLRITSARS